MLRFLEWFFGLFLKNKLSKLKAEIDAEKYATVKEYENAKEKYSKKFLKRKRYRKVPSNKNNKNPLN